jgi:2',3'-cyclic-nucleotide 2'-phosphodiesterase (5'-nucleotidase family)/DNA-binding beta-propeller fold protein YncE
MPFSGPMSDQLVVSTRFQGVASAGAGGAEVAAARADALFILGPAGVDVRTPDGTLLGSIDTSGFGGANSVALSANLAAVAITAPVKTDPGTVALYQVDVTGGVLTATLVDSFTVGANPDQLVFTADGTKLLVANEGEPSDYTSGTGDPEGSVSIIDVAGGTVQTAGFSAFNGQADALRDAGVRIFGPNATVAQDLEPEYIALSADGTTAYVTLQENNALAILDIATATVASIVPLGFKNHGLAGNGLDASDRDGPGSGGSSQPAIHIATHAGLYGMYQPDAIAGFTANGQQYFVTANEGDSRTDWPGLNEEARISSLTLDSAFPGGNAIKGEDEAGRLNVTNQLGNPDGDGDLDALYAFGARSISIWDADGHLVWDSGDAIEQAIAALDPNWAEPSAAQRGTLEGLGDDTRSDNKGPEPEGITLGTIDGETFAFVGLERSNAVMLFKLDDEGATPEFDYWGVFHTQGDIGPEVFAVIDASISASGNTELLVSNEVSGTTTLYEIAVAPQPFTLQLLHASDLEAGLLATGRMGNFAAIVDRLEDEYANTITLITGDAWLPGPFYAAEADPSLEAPLEAFYGVNLPSGPQISGRVSLAFMNAIGTDAASFGNHEFDLGTRAIRDIIAQSGTYPGAQFPYLSANLDFSGDVAALGAGNLAGLVVADGQEASSIKGRIAGTSVVTINGEKIGLVGATTQILPSISSPGAVQVIGDDIDDMPQLAAILQPKIDALLAQGLNKVVVMSHLQQFALEQALTPLLSGIDIMISSGNHSLFADASDPLRPSDVPVETYPNLLTNADGDAVLQVNSTNEYAYVNRLVVQFDADGRIIPASVDPAVSGVFKTDDGGVQAVYGADIADAFAPGSKGARVDALADAVQAVISAQDGNTFGYTDVFLNGQRTSVRREESNLGDLTADANLWYAKQVDPTVTVSIKNGGGIRDSIGTVGAGAVPEYLPPAANPAAGKEEGEVSQLDIANSLRFNNTLSLLTVTAQELIGILEHGVAASTATGTPGQFPQVGGVNFSWDISEPGGSATVPGDGRVVNATIVDEDGTILDVLMRNGVMVGDADREIRVVTLNFMAEPSPAGSQTGGDGYPFPAFGTNRVDLIQAGVRTGAATFADNGSEQDALAEYFKAVHPTKDTAYTTADTPATLDVRNQQLALRIDTVEPVLGFDLWRDSVGTGSSLTEWRNLASSLDYTNGRVAAEQHSGAYNDSTGVKLARFLSGDGDVAIREVDFAGLPSVGGSGAMTLDWQGRNAALSLDAAWNSIANIRLNEFTGDTLTVKNFAMVAFNFTNTDSRPDIENTLVLEGVKRINGRSGDGADHIVIGVDSDGGPVAENRIVLTTNGGDDHVEIRVADADYAPGAYDQLWTRSIVSLGDGDDSFLGGDGQDIVTGGAGNDVLDGRGGFDQAIFSGSRADYVITVLDPATNQTMVVGTDGSDMLVNFDQLRFDDAVLNMRGGIWA